MFVGDGSTPWQEPPPDIPDDSYSCGWNSHHRIASALWGMRKPFFGRFNKAQTRGRDILVWFVFLSATLLAEAANLHKSVFALKSIDYMSIVCESMIAFLILWGILQPYFNLAFACFPYFRPPTVRRQPLTWTATKKPLALTALFLGIVLAYAAILVTPVSSWQKIGSADLNTGTEPGYYQTLAPIDEHTLLFGHYPGVVPVDFSNPHPDPSQFPLPGTTAMVSYNSTLRCAAAANSESIAWGQLTDFPRNMRAVLLPALNKDNVRSIGSDCRSMTIATDHALYFIDLTSAPSPKYDSMPLSGFTAGQFPRLFTTVVNPSGETTAFCGDGLWILRRKDHSSMRVGTCEVESSHGGISFDEHGNRLSWVENATTIGILDVVSGSVVHVLIERRERANAVDMISTALSPGGRFLAVGLPEEVRIYNLVFPSKPAMVAVYEGDRNLIGSSQILFMTDDYIVAIVDQFNEHVTVMRWGPHGIRNRIMKALVYLKIRPDDASSD